MRTPFIFASLALVSCTESSTGDVLTDDAAAVTSADAAAPRTFLPSSMDASAGARGTNFPSSSQWRPAYCEAPAAASLPASPTNFRVELGQTECFGTCPAYSMSVDQDGRVTYYGENWVTRFGPHQKQVSSADARAIYDALYQAGYSKLNRCYRDAVDGCSLWTDSPYSNWNVSADGVTKAVDRYHGCDHPSPELSQVDAVARVVREKAGLNAWVPSTPSKPQPPPGPMKPTAYRLSSSGKSLGTLTILPSEGPVPPPDASVALGGYRWQLVDCAKVPQASGTMRVKSPFYVLLAGESRFESNPPRFIKEKLPIALSTVGDVGSILIEVPMSGGLPSAHAQRGDEDIPLELVADQPGC